MADDEFAAFQAEMDKLEAPTVGPRAPQVITAAPSGPTVTKVAKGPLPTGTPTVGGARVPVSQWPRPEQLVSSIQQDYPDAIMPALGKPSGAVAAGALERRDERPVAGAATGLAAGVSSAAAALSSGKLAPGQMPGDGTLKLAEPPRPDSKKPLVPPQGGGGGGALGKRKAELDVTKRMVAGKGWVDDSLADWPEDDFRIFVGDLGNETNDDVLAHAFSKYPSFQKAKVIRNKHTQKSMGYGFVSFKDPWDMTKALREMVGKYIGNRPVKVRKSTWKERAGDNKDMDWAGSAALAVNDKSLAKGLGGKKKFMKKKKGMPW